MNTKTLTDTELEIKLTKGWAIILYNDNINTFEHVINCLMKYCKHNSLQAEQCASIVHFNGKTDIKRGDVDELKPVYEALQDNNLKVKLEPI